MGAARIILSGVTFALGFENVLLGDLDLDVLVLVLAAYVAARSRSGGGGGDLDGDLSVLWAVLFKFCVAGSTAGGARRSSYSGMEETEFSSNRGALLSASCR